MSLSSKVPRPCSLTKMPACWPSWIRLPRTVGLPPVLDLNPGPGVGGDVVVLEGPQALLVDDDARLLAVVDAVASDGGVAALPDLDPGHGVGEDVVVLEGPQALLDDEDAGLAAVVNGVPPNAWVCAAVDRNPRAALARDVAVLELKASLRYLHAEIVAVAGLLEREVGDSTDIGLEHERAARPGAHDDVLEGTLSDDLERLVYKQPLFVQAAPHEEPRARERGLDRRADRRVIALAPRIDAEGGRLVASAGRLIAGTISRRVRLSSSTLRNRGRRSDLRDVARRLHAPEAFVHPARQLRQALTDDRRGERLKPQLAPVSVLTVGQLARERVTFAPLGDIELGCAHVVDREDEVFAAQLSLTL